MESKLSITQGEAYSVLAFGIKITHAIHRSFFADLGYGRTTIVNKTILDELQRQTNRFIESQDEKIFSKRLPILQDIPEFALCAADITDEEYADLIHPDPKRYENAVLRFEQLVGMECIDKKKEEIGRLIGNSTSSYCRNTSPIRTVFDYNTGFLTFDPKSLEEKIIRSTGILPCNLPAYTLNITHLSADYTTNAKEFFKI